MSDADASLRRKRPSSRLEPITREVKRSRLTRAALREQERVARQTWSEDTAQRQRQHSRGTPVSEYLSSHSPESLTALKSFAKHGGPDLTDLRGHLSPAPQPRHTMSRQKRDREASLETPTSTSNTKKSRSSGAYDSYARQRMIDNGIYPYGYADGEGQAPPGPENEDDLRTMMTRYRSSLSPSVFDEDAFKKFTSEAAQIVEESMTMQQILPTIQGKVRDLRCIHSNVQFKNLAGLTDDEPPRHAMPDLYCGARPEQLSSDVRDELSRYIQPSTVPTYSIAPNFFVEAKGMNGTPFVMINQACFDGALGARAMHSLRTYGDDPPLYDNNAYTMSSTYQDGALKIYAHHAAQPNGPGTKPSYYMTQLRAFSMTDSADTLRQGITAFRNTRDWAKAQRDEVIQHANSVRIARQDRGDADAHEGDENGASDVDADDVTDAGALTSTSQTSPPSGRRNIRKVHQTSPKAGSDRQSTHASRVRATQQPGGEKSS